MSRQTVSPTGQKNFDSKVHHKDAKGNLSRVRPYTRYCFGDREYNWDKESRELLAANGDVIPPAQYPAELRHLLPVAAAVAKAPVAPVASLSAADKKKQEAAAKKAAADKAAAAKAAADKAAAEKTAQDPNPEPALDPAAAAL